jgi:replication initiation protein RepC
LQHITLKQALNASSDRFKDHIPLEQRAMNWHDVVTAAYSLKGELHISQNAWSHACVTLGRTGAAICLLLTDQATQRADDPVRKPAGYFNAMINRAKSGELHLNKSIFGILKREDGSEI